MKMKVKFKWNKPVDVLVNEKVRGRDNMLFLAQVAKNYMDEYVPEDAGFLAQNVRITADDDAGHILYNSPYAHYQYMGEVYGPNYPIVNGGEVVGFYSPPHKTPTGEKIDYSRSHARKPLATDHWDKAMMTARKNDLAKSYENHLKGRSNDEA